MKKPALLIAGLIISLAAVSPPAHDLAVALFSAHMVQHLVLVLVAGPLIAIGSPRIPMLSALSVLVLHTGAMWAWHLPSAYEAAMESSILHVLEHLSFLVTAVLFWSFVLARRDISAVQRVGVTFATGLQSGALGALLVFAARPLYDSHVGRTFDWGMTALEDQQLAGAIMWVPPGIVYLAVMLAILYRWFTGLDGAPVEAQPVSGAR